MDTETEGITQENSERLVEDRTAFIIAHRPSTTQDADRIVVMEDGRIIETGTRGSLVDESGGRTRPSGTLRRYGCSASERRRSSSLR